MYGCSSELGGGGVYLILKNELTLLYSPSLVFLMTSLKVDSFCFLFFSKVLGFVWPRRGLEDGRTLLELLESERFVSRPLLVHAFSIGGYTFSQLLVHVSKDAHKYQAFKKRIAGQIYDSMVAGSLEHMATGQLPPTQILSNKFF